MTNWIIMQSIMSIIMIGGLIYVHKLQKRIEKIEDNVVRQVMEDDPALVEKFLKVQKELYASGGLNGKDATVTACKILGLPHDIFPKDTFL